MRPGLFPSQQRALRKALKKADKFDHFRRRTRRTFLGLGALGLFAGVTGFAAGRHRSRSVDTDTDDDTLIGQHRSLAAAPIARLRAGYIVFLASMEQAPADPRFWVGFERLATHALETRDAELIRRLRVTANAVPIMSGYEWVVERVKGQ
jgi:hypothetical protein